jgi:plasmid stabilization system protein ParE
LKIRLLLPARRELRVAVHYYDLQRTNLGTEFREEAWTTIQRISEFPQAWHPLGGNIRRCQMIHFPYGIIYEPAQTEIVVIAVACLHQAPEYWHDRVK